MAVQYIHRVRGRTVIVLPASFPHSVVITLGNCSHKIKVLDIPLGVGGGEINYAHQSFVTTPHPGK